RAPLVNDFFNSIGPGYSSPAASVPKRIYRRKQFYVGPAIPAEPVSLPLPRGLALFVCAPPGLQACAALSAVILQCCPFATDLCVIDANAIRARRLSARPP